VDGVRWLLGALIFGPLWLASLLAFGVNEIDVAGEAQTSADNVAAVVSPRSVDRANDGSLVYISGRAGTTVGVEDSDLGLRVPALMLIRHVECASLDTHLGTLQWVAKDLRLTSGRGPRHLWSRHFVSPDARLAGYTLTWEELVRLQTVPFRVPETLPLQLPDGALPGACVRNGDLYLPGDKAQAGAGDWRIRYEVVLPQEASIVGVQNGDRFKYLDRRLMKPAVATGRVSAAVLFAEASSRRHGGGLLMRFFIVPWTFIFLFRVLSLFPSPRRHLIWWFRFQAFLLLAIAALPWCWFGYRAGPVVAIVAILFGLSLRTGGLPAPSVRR
jgi:hypothetical protein